MPMLLRKQFFQSGWIVATCLLTLLGTKLHAQESDEAGSIIPTAPIAFETVYLELPLACSFGWADTYAPEFHQVASTSDGLRVRVRRSGMSYNPAGCGPRYRVRLGNLPQGIYTTTLYIDDSTSPEAQYEFTVSDSGVGDTHAPAFDYSGLYWDPHESGSGLQVIQTGRENLGAVLLTYDNEGGQQWIAIGVGQWQSPGRYVGQAWRTRDGHPLDAPSPEERISATPEVIGEAAIDFGGGIGIDPLSASIRITTPENVIYRRDYQRLEF